MWNHDADWVYSLGCFGKENAEGRVAFRVKKINLVLNLLGFEIPVEHPSVDFQKIAGYMNLQIRVIMEILKSGPRITT